MFKLASLLKADGSRTSRTSRTSLCDSEDWSKKGGY